MDLSYNRLGSLPKSTFKDLKDLKTLDLSNNRLKSVDGTIAEKIMKLC